MSDEDYVIRHAVLSDLDELFALFIDLITHEGLLNNLKLDRERLKQELFGADADWNCLVAAKTHNQLIGFCFYSYANTDRAFNFTPKIHIDDLYVSPKYRRINIGHQLLHQLALIAQSQNISRFNVLCVKDNREGQNFYQKIGATKLDFLDFYKISVDQLL
ncbi:MAG: GNAT family N-acetyltransferase [Legionella sp.]